MMMTVTLLSCHSSYGHHSKKAHVDEIREALGFEPNQYIDDWIGFISSDMIDKPNPFYTELTEYFPGFKCKHRQLFHWNYNGEPWTKSLESKITAYAISIYGDEKYREHLPSIIEAFKTKLRNEQKRRNGIINRKTETVFGFASGGKDGSYANFFAAMAYDLHLLGDYMSDNKDLNGLVEFKTLIGGIITSINRLDSREGKSIVKSINAVLALPNDGSSASIQKKNDKIQKKADKIMEIIKKELPEFIRNAENGSIKRRLEKRGFKFIK